MGYGSDNDRYYGGVLYTSGSGTKVTFFVGYLSYQVPDVATALAAARDILATWISTVAAPALVGPCGIFWGFHSHGTTPKWLVYNIL